MSGLASPALSAWQSFYGIVGSSAAALIGIQFVVIALIGNMRKPVIAEAISAFGTPTVVHLASVLLVAATMSVPWPSLSPTSIALLMRSCNGLAYGAIVIRRARRQTYYKPERQSSDRTGKGKRDAKSKIHIIGWNYLLTMWASSDFGG